MSPQSCLHFLLWMVLWNGEKEFLIINSMHGPLQNAFLDKCVERKDNRYLLDSLSSSKGNQTETIEEFNKWFNRIVQKSPCKY